MLDLSIVADIRVYELLEATKELQQIKVWVLGKKLADLAKEIFQEIFE